MKLNLKLQKVLALATLATVGTGAIPTTIYALDYETHWAKEAIDEWSSAKVLEGYEDGTFRPSNYITRSEVATVLVRLFGLSDTTHAEDYADVVKNAWYEEAVRLVSSAGLMNSYAHDTFRPNDYTTREEAAYAIAQAYSILQKASEEAISELPLTTIIPAQPLEGETVALTPIISPEEAVVSTLTYSDQAEISDWAITSILELTDKGYLNGHPDGRFAPQDTITRAEFVTMIDQITAQLFHQPGTYTQDVEGNVIINTSDVILKNMVITGNLYIAAGVGEGDVVLDGVTVAGDVIIEGGGTDSVHLTGRSKVGNIILDKAGDQPVHLFVEMLSEITGTVLVKKNATIEAQGTTIQHLIIDGAEEVSIEGSAKIEALDIKASTTLNLVDGVSIQTLTIHQEAEKTAIESKGQTSTIHTLIVNAEEVTYAAALKVEELEVLEGLDNPPEKESQTTNTGSSGGGGSTPTPSKDDVEIDAVTVHFTNAEAVEVPIQGAIDLVVDAAAQTITLEDYTFTADQMIQGITVDANTDQVSVTLGKVDMLLENTDPILIDLPTNPVAIYTLSDAVAAIKDNQHAAESKLEIIFDLAGTSEAIQNQLLELLDSYIGILDSFGDETKTVAELTTKLQSYQTRLENKYAAMVEQDHEALNTLKNMIQTIKDKQTILETLDLDRTAQSFVTIAEQLMAEGELSDITLTIDNILLDDPDNVREENSYTLNITYINQ